MRHTLLIVDDEEYIVRALVRLLRHDPYRILTASSGEQALDVLAANDVHVILSDQRMPGMSGSEFLARAREVCPESVRVVLSGYSDFASISDAVNHGNIYKFIAKPWNDELLRATLAEACERYDLSRNSTQLTKIYENSAEAIFIADADGNIQSVNPAFTRVTGFAPEQVARQSCSDLFAWNEDSPVGGMLWAHLQHEDKWSGELDGWRHDGTRYPLRLNVSAVHDRQGHLQQYVGMFIDLSSQKAADERMRHATFHDALTGLPNRTMFMEYIGTALLQANRRELMCGIVMFDLDRFKNINDSFGHDFGDRLLVAMSSRVMTCLRREDLLARLGGDEFALLLPMVSGVDDIRRVAEKILAACESPVRVDATEVFVTPSLGISCFPRDGDMPETLLRNAEAAMYDAKQGGRNTYRVYQAEMNAETGRRLSLEQDLRRAVEREEFLLHYQPKVSLHDGRIIGAEALLRWQHPVRGLVPPGVFIPLAETSGLINVVGEWVLDEVCRQIAEWRGKAISPPCIALNLSASQFQRQNTVDLLTRVLAARGVSGSEIELELTEGALVSDDGDTVETLMMFKRMGLSLAIDDFGTGYSSLSYLSRFPIDTLKIDASFVRDLTSCSASTELVRSIIEMAHRLKLSVVAEGVETAEQLAILRQYDCDCAQGFYFARAVPADDFAALICRNQAYAL
ncbi:putative bifunctional diguanylate cyclase/phosphodiesterase [Propionivibrio dicarboxylicus]|uniref:PAS domain S-box-containing protein/diguanylate cyclase (GGDEF) domain-containing protein n=1 Tax=Propionivibrio dicarboxylicus TaxID=83767 RepID=A0A1G8DTJ3_9RHOO|nr:EAL domain-containing protein [Propionivibrio dicarboxylicus]SDH60928.1 PAS domain S-box-containing protein/diguanylate cyclase (GGDEF) domain-containing protein [Propionivibrio dicarboxylicus]